MTNENDKSSTNNDASITFKKTVKGESTVEGGEIHTRQSEKPTTNTVAIIFEDEVDDVKVKGGKIYISSELKAETKEILDQVAEEQVNAIKKKIKLKPRLQQRLWNASKAGGTEAIKALFDHPVVSISVEAMKGFLETEADN